MFTGLIEEVGTISVLRPVQEGVNIRVQCHHVLEGTADGDSISVDGVCLTVTDHSSEYFNAYIGAETLRKTNLVFKQLNMPVNLERSLSLNQRLGGHMVQGHIDGTARASLLKQEGDSQIWRFDAPETVLRYLVPKGSIAINGVSLTVIDCYQDHFTVMLIPKTLSATTFGSLRSGETVNIETDIIGRYVYKFLHPEEQTSEADINLNLIS